MGLSRPSFLLFRRLGVITALLASGTAGHTVQPGDTLSELAERLGVAALALAEANGLADPDRLVAGRRLRLPGEEGGAGGRIHVVSFGETLSGIAARYGVSTASLARGNGMGVGDLLLAGRTLQVPGAASAPTGRAAIEALLEDTADRYGLDPALVKAVAWQESGWKSRVVSPDGAVGVMQVLPSTGRFVANSLVGRPLDLTDPADNIEAGAAFLAYLDRLTSDDRTMLAGYYQGLASLRANGPYLDTERYIDNVLVLRARFS